MDGCHGEITFTPTAQLNKYTRHIVPHFHSPTFHDLTFISPPFHSLTFYSLTSHNLKFHGPIFHSLTFHHCNKYQQLPNS